MLMKAIQTLNFMRSAMAPRISAGVMIANIAWNMMKTYWDVARRGGEVRVTESIVTPAADLREVADPGVAGAEREAVADQDPEHADDASGDEALHEDIEDVLGAHQAAVEQGEAGERHHQDERRAGEHPGGVATVDDRRRLLGPGRRVGQQRRDRRRGGERE
jgi:hypothetical protein